jgi:Protein of unknown function (DUF2950)
MKTPFTLLAGLTLGFLLSGVLAADDPAPAGPQQSEAASQNAATGAVSSPGSASDESEAKTEEPEVPPMRFETADAAAMALIDAAAAEGSDALYGVLGSDLEDLVSGDPVADAADRKRFVELAQDSASIEDETEDSAILVVGPEDWPFPIPLAKDDKGWYFDTQAGIEEILDRRIGLNELNAIATARAFVDAETEYKDADPNGDGIHAYAARFWSTEGKKDGLYWPTKEGESESPMGPLVAEAVEEGYKVREEGEGPRPYHGYYFRILTAQGPHAPGGAKSYLNDGHLTDGVALLAWPATYGNSGIMSFQVNQRGLVYQADLGEDTASTAEAITAYDPGEGWEPVVD